MKIVGLDPSLTNTGLVILTNSSGGYALPDWNITKLVLHETQSATKNKETSVKIRKNYDDLSRARGLLDVLLEETKDADYIAVEIPQIGGQDMQARSMWTSGIALGLIACLPQDKIVALTPADVKLATGNSKASKEEMCAWAYTCFPHAAWPSRKVNGSIERLKKNHHLADATAAAYVALKRMSLLH